MKKLIIALGLVASTVAMASVDEYSFTSTVKVPNVAGNARSGYYRQYASVKYTGTLIVDSDDPTAVTGVLELSNKKGQTFKADLDAEAVAVLTGKKLNVPAVQFSAGSVDTDGFALCFAGMGSVKTKTTGCGPCGSVETCTRVTTMSGYVTGLYDCGCENDQYPVIDGTCDIDYTKETNIAPVWGQWSAKLVKVDGAKYK